MEIVETYFVSMTCLLSIERNVFVYFVLWDTKKNLLRTVRVIKGTLDLFRAIFFGIAISHSTVHNGCF